MLELNKKNLKSLLRTGSALGLGLTLSLTSAVALAVNPDTATLPNGANLSVKIDNPMHNEENRLPANANGAAGGAINVVIDGEASVGEGEPTITLVYVVDLSGSTASETCGSGVILDCEIDAVKNVDADPNMASVSEVGIAVFASGGAAADMSGDAGDQLLIDPNAAPDNRVETVIDSAFSEFGGDGGLTEFSPRSVGVSTDFSEGLAAATLILLGAAPGNTLRVLYMSDGGSTAANAPGGFAAQLAAIVATGAIVDTVAVGALAGCDRVQEDPAFGTLQEISDATGGACFPLPEPADLPGFLPNLLFTSLDSIQVAVDNADIPTNTSPSLPADGPLTAVYDATANLGAGAFSITAAVEGRDSVGSETVVANVTKQVLQLIASPFTASNNLSEDNTHTVNGEILGGTGPDRDIDFVVGGQNAGRATPQSGSVSATPGGGAVSFSYTVPNEHGSLGQDTITVSTTIADVTDSITLTVEWVGAITPIASCSPGGNPGGNEPQAPGKGGKGQNQDGFYLLGVADNLSGACCAAEVQILVTDSGSGTVFGPFPVGTVIKYTQASSAAPRIKKMGGGKANNVSWHIIGTGDAEVSAVDQSGNTSAPVSCLVPPPPK